MSTYTSKKANKKHEQVTRHVCDLAEEQGVFFFSSRRRHTRCGRDWSSDVCSSDLCSASTHAARWRPTRSETTSGTIFHQSHTRRCRRRVPSASATPRPAPNPPTPCRRVAAATSDQIGRASCRERGEISVVAGSLKK